MAYRGLVRGQLAKLAFACHHDTRENDEDPELRNAVVFVFCFFFFKLSKGAENRVTSFLLSCNKIPGRDMFSPKTMQYCSNTALGRNCSFHQA